MYRRSTNPLPQLVPQRVLQTKALVERSLWQRVIPVEVQGGPVNDVPIDLVQAVRQPLAPVPPGSHFGPPGGGWKQRWFTLDIPAAREGEGGRRHLRWDCEGETTVYFGEEPWAGLDIAHRTCPLPDEATTLWLDCSTWQTGIWLPGSGLTAGRIGPYGLRFDGCSLRLRDSDAWNASAELDVLTQLMQVLFARDRQSMAGPIGYAPPLDACSPLLRLLLRGLDDACDAFVHSGLGGLRTALGAITTRLPAEAWQPVAALCGHAHLDLVWLWPEMATERKGIHTFATQLRLLERYPEITFVQSQPALYRAIERQAPALVKQARSFIRDGRWEVLGGFEVEPDTNLPCGEALARSLQHGQRKIAALRGTPSSVCWIPDVFGYSACLPQILRLGGVRSFFTTKMTWSAVTKFSYNSFVWRGSDGSDVVAHLCPTGYNGTVAVENLVAASREHRQADVHPEVLLPTGFGDGGGGLTEEMCERARRLADLSGVPRTRWTTVEGFFDRLAAVREQLPVHQGELYLEYHRGTYTTQSELKRLYRAAESALQTHEAVRVATDGRALDEHPWLRVLFCQFHDALPGSSIARVYDEINDELAALAAREVDAATSELSAAASGRGPSVFNPLPLPRTIVVDLPPTKESGKRAASQTVVTVPPLASVRLAGTSRARLKPVRVATTLLDNGIVRATLDASGQLAGLAIDGQPLALDGVAGFVLHHDLPANFDAWDIDHYSYRTGRPVATTMKLEIAERSPLRAIVRGRASIGARSELVVSYILEAGARHLRIDAQVDWRETHELLKFYVPTRYRGRWARFGCPFGSIQRPQLPGTGADEAMWEVPGSRWAAVTDEDSVGLAICTEAKYGFSCRDGVLGLTLLRSPTMPDPKADIGTHQIRFAVGRHETITGNGILSTAAAADALFAPFVTVSGGRTLGAPFGFEDLGSLVPSWVKPAESGRAYIVRLHETNGGSGSARVRFTTPPRSVERVDFLEQRIGAAQRLDARTFAIDYRPYEIIGLRVTRGSVQKAAKKRQAP